jgi:RNA exonuclease 4
MHTYKKPDMPAKRDYVALDCEMVATGDTSCCARVVLVDWKGRTILDEYTKPTRKVTDYRTFVSGIKPEHLVNAEDFEVVREKVKKLLAGKILVGHALENDLKCLNLDHPWQRIRDTANYEPFMKNHYGLLLPRKLKELSQEKLQREIQVDGKAHSPVEDAIAALDLYKSHRPRWEACVLNQIKEGQRAVISRQTLPQDNYPEFFEGIPIAVYP